MNCLEIRFFLGDPKKSSFESNKSEWLDNLLLLVPGFETCSFFQEYKGPPEGHDLTMTLGYIWEAWTMESLLIVFQKKVG